MPTPKPDSYVRLNELAYDDEPTFGTPSRTYVRNHGAGTFVFGGQTLPLSERAPLAAAIDGVFQADFSGPVDPNGFTVNGGAFAVVPVLDGTATVLESIQVGSQVYTLAAAAALEKAIIADLAL